MSSLVLLTSCWWQFTIVPIKVALIKTMTVKVTDISTTLEKTLMATSNEMVISTVTNNSLFLIQSISLHLCLQLTANPGFKLFIMNCSKNYQLRLENWPVERIPYWLNVCLRKEVLPKWSSSKEMILAGCNLTLQLPEVINMELLPKCPYIIQQTGITNTQNNLADVILIQHQILITNKQGNV